MKLNDVSQGVVKMNNKELVFVWSAKIRMFHWVNVICILLLMAIGLIIFNAKMLGISVDAKISLKTWHVLIGYVFAINLLFRLLLGWIGKGFERFAKMLPFMSGFISDLKAFKANTNKVYQGHNPVGKLMVAMLLVGMINQMITGLLLASTDIYYPPLGNYFAGQIAVDKTAIESIKPYSKNNVDPQAYQQMRDIRYPFVYMHVDGFYFLLGLIPLHIAAVVYAERKHKQGLVSAMINGHKYLPKD